MGQYQETGEAAATAMRLQRYAEALLGTRKEKAGAVDGQGAVATEKLSLIRMGNLVSFFYIGIDGHADMGIYERKRDKEPKLVKRHVYMDGMEYDGVRYSYPDLIVRYGGQDVQVFKSDDTLYVFGMSGELIMHIQCRK